MREGIALDASDRPVSPTDEHAARWSLIGAIGRINPPLLLVVAIEHAGGCDIPSIQNRSTHPELLRILWNAKTWLEEWE